MTKPARVPGTYQRHLEVQAAVAMLHRHQRKARNWKAPRKVTPTLFDRVSTTPAPPPAARRRFRDLIRRRQGARG